MAKSFDPKSDRIARGNKAPSPLGSATFVGLRAADPVLQYGILAQGWGSEMITRLGSTTVANGPLTNSGISWIDRLNISPYRLVLLGMATGASLKHIVWKLAIGEEYMDAGTAGMVGAFNSVFNAANSLLFVCAATSPGYGRGEGPGWKGFPGAPLAVGSVLFATGLAVELVSEVQRKAFKAQAANAGKPYTGGLFGLARHVNYTGYTLWRTGYALAAGGWLWGALTAALFTWDFSTRAVPTKEAYCQDRYADLWHDYAARTPAVLVPGLL